MNFEIRGNSKSTFVEEECVCVCGGGGGGGGGKEKKKRGGGGGGCEPLTNYIIFDVGI